MTQSVHTCKHVYTYINIYINLSIYIYLYADTIKKKHKNRFSQIKMKILEDLLWDGM